MADQPSTHTKRKVPGPGTQAGDDVVVTLPSGREIEGRIIRWIGGRADVSVTRPNARRFPYTDVHFYPKSWIRPWED